MGETQSEIFEKIKGNVNQTKYVVAFCHNHWSEKLTYETINSKNMYNFEISEEERNRKIEKHFDLEFPC